MVGIVVWEFFKVILVFFFGLLKIVYWFDFGYYCVGLQVRCVYIGNSVQCDLFLFFVYVIDCGLIVYFDIIFLVVFGGWVVDLKEKFQ